ncbi:hydroxyphenylacetyl-CoA thioesterase PaaI [Pseudomonas syringae]|nr:hydroxyphenylacetyl-CoA thioesterase PaaI [Pseudomonas syringae]MBD8788894.1 hydroxyphenylacetyl-CoA thioesterase PaaI [Pseudomonas syringae]MBD8803131.1 hydroxyphenylacetyl-CoA thioesterase PaaI [Pseudomonas syringae]MBD8813841.1 hydroxyphenylacetyl-CoA thioesterase PaaI [Pseudomonas syringae]
MTTDPQQLAEICANTLFERDAASKAMGMRLLSISPGHAQMVMTVRPDMLQGVGTCHGGHLFALADSAFAFACNTYNAVTVALGCSIDYVAPGRLGDELTATASEQSRSGRTGNYDVRIENQHGQLIALFHGKSYQVRGTLIDPELSQ